jgi:chromosome transmission fidelity protein 18
VLEQELQKERLRRENDARQARFRAGAVDGEGDCVAGLLGKTPSNGGAGGAAVARKRDFFGRTIIHEATRPSEATAGHGVDPASKNGKPAADQDENNVWITFHEGFSNAVRKPITLRELLADL